MTNDPSIPNKAKNDQIMAAWRDSIPPTLWNMYCGFIQTGFSAEQSLDLTKYAWTQISENVKRNDGNQSTEEL